MLTQYINIQPSSCIKEIFCDYQNNTLYIKFTSNKWKSFGAENMECYSKIIIAFYNSTSPGKTFHKFKNSGKLSKNGNIYNVDKRDAIVI